MRRTILSAAVLASTLAAIALPSAASADPICPRGDFCANTDVSFRGMQVNWYGDDGFWESNINNQDSSWANQGVTGPGVPAYVKVYDGFWQFGSMTICVPPNSYIFERPEANDRGSSHKWSSGC
jgi:peptidase inhibitor family I36